VYPNFEDYLNHADDIRFAFNASLPAFQLADVMYEFYEHEDPSKISQWKCLVDFHKYLAEKEPAYLTIQSIATAYKHLRPKGSFYEIGSPMALWGLTLPADDLDLDSSLQGRRDVIARRKDGTQVSVTDALTAVINLWPRILPEEKPEQR